MRFLFNATILCNKFNIQSFFSNNIKAKQYESINKNKAINRLELQSGISEDMILFASLKYFPCPGYPYQWQWQDLEDHQKKTAERKLKWDEENRLLASDDNGFVTNYWYDVDGERTVKTSDVRTYSVIKKMGNNMINFDDIHEQEQ